MWIAVSIVVGLVAIAVVVVAATVMHRRDPDRQPTEMSGDEMFTLGIVFTGAGIALFVSTGPAMIGVFALGLIFMLMGARKKREQ